MKDFSFRGEGQFCLWELYLIITNYNVTQKGKIEKSRLREERDKEDSIVTPTTVWWWVVIIIAHFGLKCSMTQRYPFLRVSMLRRFLNSAMHS
jgi:lysozyme family protein